MDAKDDRESSEHQTYSWRDRAVYLVFRAVIAAMQSISLERCQRISRVLAYWLTHILPIRRKLVAANLELVFPNWSPDHSLAVQQSMWEHLLLMVCEIAHAPRKVHRENYLDFFRIGDRRRMLSVILDHRPKVLVSGHFGNFELAGFVTGLFGISTTTIARPLDNGFIHDYLTQFRSLGGQHFLPKTGSATAIEALLQQGGALSLLADQYGGPKGCWVDFLGHPASCHKALALFTLSSGAPMMVCSNVRREAPLHFDLDVLGVADPQSPDCPSSVQTMTRWYNECLESAIRSHPEQYWWVHRRWRGEPPRRNKPAIAA
ncbi:MAG: lysophospholipid acyltransferase family protein [Pirellula sp.]